LGIQVDIDISRCTGCSHCKDNCPVDVFELRPRDQVPDVIDDPSVAIKFQFRGEKSLVVQGSQCFVCRACLTECEGECILITDTEGNVHFSSYE
jgi:NAD-dependent dihydropyrimidine dehydrogenase PreA subunit